MSVDSSNSSKSSKSSGGEGNTNSPPKDTKKKQISPAKRWCFTWNNYIEDWAQHLDPIISSKFHKYCIGKEVGENGTPHLQGYVEFKKKIRPFSLKLSEKIWWKKCKGNRQSNLDYCSKDGDFISNFPTKKVEKPKYKIDIVFWDWQKRVHQILSKEPDDRSIHWIWEPEGCKGKTTFQKWVFLNMDKVVVISGKGSDIKNCIVTYQNKNHCLPKIVLINIPRTSMNYVSYTGIEEIKDMFFYSPKYEGGMVCGPNPHVMIFANSEPDFAAMSDDRWQVTRI